MPRLWAVDEAFFFSTFPSPSSSLTSYRLLIAFQVNPPLKSCRQGRGAAVVELCPLGLTRSRYIFLFTQPLTDKWQANLLVCSDAVRIRHHRRRSRCRSGGASRPREARKRDFAAPQRAAHRTQSTAFLS